MFRRATSPPWPRPRPSDGLSAGARPPAALDRKPHLSYNPSLFFWEFSSEQAIDVSPNGKKENILTSWKEIAAYLDRDVRTCVRWEKRYGLPIHRLERDSKAKVFAYKDQIDEWLVKRLDGEGPRRGRTGPLRLLFQPLPLVFVLGVLAAAYFLLSRPTVPADFHIRGSELVIVDGRDRELWRFNTRLAELKTESDYREHFQEKRLGGNYVPIWPRILIRDIDGDAQPEVLFSTQTRFDNEEAVLICFDRRGGEKWRFKAGGKLVLGAREIRQEFRIFGFDVDDYDGDGALEILVLSFHHLDWPCQAALLSPSGKLEGEYWNAGYLMDGSAGDVDGDGQKELLLSGVNNEYRRGCVAVFKPGQLRGSSPQNDEAFRFAGLEEGGQSAYILFPNSEIHAAMQVVGDPVNHFVIHDGNGLTAVTTETQIFYDLDRLLVCRDITLSNYLQNLCEKLSLQGKLLPALDETYRKRLASELLYFKGGHWLPAPPAVVSARARKAR